MGVFVVFLTKCSQRDFARHGQGGREGKTNGVFLRVCLYVCVICVYVCMCVCFLFFFFSPGLWISVCLTLAGYSLTWWSFKGQTASSSTTTTKYRYQSVTGCNEVQDIVVFVVVVMVVVVMVDMVSIRMSTVREEEEEERKKTRSNTVLVEKLNAVCVTETSKCKKIKHKITGKEKKKSVFVTSIPIHSKNNMELISHTHPDNNRAMPDEGLFVWSRALSIIGGDVLAIHTSGIRIFHCSILFLFYILYFICLSSFSISIPFFPLFSLSSLLYSSIPVFNPLLTDAQHAAQFPTADTLNQCIRIQISG